MGNPVLAEGRNDLPWSLWTVPSEGGAPTLLFQNGEIGATRPAWSWDTGLIAFTGVRAGSAELYVIDDQGGHLARIPVRDPPRQRLFYPSWYPGGRAVALTDYKTHQVLRVEMATGRVTPLTDPEQVWAGMSSVSGEGMLALAGQRPGGSYDPGNNSIWIQAPQGGLYELDGKQGRHPAWSPRGDRIAFTSTRARRAPAYVMHPRTLGGGTNAVFVAPAMKAVASPKPATAVTPFEVSAKFGKWSPDGSRLVFVAHADDGTRGIAIVELFGEAGQGW